MEHNRILELAIQELERRRAALSAEIETLRSELNGTGIRLRRKGPQNAAARKAQSLRMKKYWAAKRAKAAKAKAKVRAMTRAQKRALSLKMKEAWKKRRAEEAKKRA